ncbi:formylglycine-generating enzyme family protein [Chloroflexi bacterium CFX6]|nr:formylglycine-generating enzyme family protein [Chloroflexi bacterium CFX6]
MGKFVEGLSGEWPHEECHKVFAEGLGDNPRQIKRTVNTFLMLSKLAEKRKEKLKGQVKPIRLAKVVAIQAAHPDLYNLLLKDEPRYLRELEEYYRAESSQERKMERGESPLPSGEGKGEGRVEPPPALVPFLSQRGIAAVRKILTMKHKPGTKDANFAGLSTDELKLYFTLTRSVEAPQPTPPAAEAARLVFEPQMVRIPAGKFLMGTTKEQAQQVIKEGGEDWKKWVGWEQPQHTVELSEYSIGKYPITNREYQAFVRDAKYKPPQGWDGDQFPAEKGSHPVVNVSWNDANEYCKWLSEKTKKNYRLPTEAEWEKAARWKPSPDGRGQGEGEALIYPWGNDFDPKKANTVESKIGDTTDVGKFSSNDPAQSGDSPYGCADMAGNVWEWCNDWFKEDEYKGRADKITKDPQGPEDGQSRVLRGGSFNLSLGYARCANRFGSFPINFVSLWGFRVASSPIIKSEL